MAEAIALSAALLDLITLTFDTSKKLYDNILSYRNQQKAVKDVLNELEALMVVLNIVRDYTKAGPQDSKLSCLETPVKSCLTICQEMGTMLDQCTIHSRNGQNSIRDWLKQQYRAKTLDEMKQRLDSYKSTLSIAFHAVEM